MLRDKSLHPLSHQHHNGLALAVMVERSLAADASEANVAKQCRRVVDRYEIELKNHFELEETLLFPACGQAGCDATLIAELVADHREMETWAAQLADAADREVLLAFVLLLRRHIRREENVLFEDAQRRIPSEKLLHLGGLLEERAVKVCLD